MKDLPGHKLGKINRLAVTLIQESGPKILSISKTDDSTGEGEARRIVEIMEEWYRENVTLLLLVHRSTFRKETRFIIYKRCISIL